MYVTADGKGPRGKGGAEDPGGGRNSPWSESRRRWNGIGPRACGRTWPETEAELHLSIVVKRWSPAGSEVS